MFVLEVEQQQVEKIKGLIDLYLRTNGLDALTDAVDLVNVLNKVMPADDYLRLKGKEDEKEES